jgi:hypothetical protein
MPTRLFALFFALAFVLVLALAFVLAVVFVLARAFVLAVVFVLARAFVLARDFALVLAFALALALGFVLGFAVAADVLLRAWLDLSRSAAAVWLPRRGVAPAMAANASRQMATTSVRITSNRVWS